jgi:hypothetical protein
MQDRSSLRDFAGARGIVSNFQSIGGVRLTLVLVIWNRTTPGLAISLFLCTCAGSQNASAAEDAATMVIRDVTVISPERPAPLEHAYVRIEGGRIAEVSRRPLKGGVQIDGRGKFLIPGLIDTHTHLREVPGMQASHRAAHSDLAAQAEVQEPRSYLYFGFTTVLSLGDTAPTIKRWNALTVRPDAYFCGGTPSAKNPHLRHCDAVKFRCEPQKRNARRPHRGSRFCFKRLLNAPRRGKNALIVRQRQRAHLVASGHTLLGKGSFWEHYQ